MKELRSIFVNLGKWSGGKGSVVERNGSKALSSSQSKRSFSSTPVNSKGAVDLAGVYPPITTPFTSDGRIDYGKLKENMNTWNSIDFAGYVVMGSNGEAVSLTTQEKIELVRNVKKMGNATSKIIAGLGLPTTEQTIEICNVIAEEGTADAALIVSPSFYKGQMNEKVLRRFYEDVGDKSKLPVIVYSVPANTSLDLSASLVTALSQHPNIIGLKDSGGDLMKISEIIHNTPSDFQVLAGSAGFMLPALVMGCVGGICALANVLGEQVAQLYNLFRRNEMDKAIHLQKTLVSPNLWVTRKLGVPGLKASMDFKGFYGGPCRLPLLPLEKDEQQALLRVFEQAGHPLRK